MFKQAFFGLEDEKPLIIAQKLPYLPMKIFVICRNFLQA